MTRPSRSEANRANAKNSTGPRTPEGKQRSAQNARCHGLTTPPGWSDVLTWYRLILGDPDAMPGLVIGDTRQATALRLAEAQARLCRVRQLQDRQALTARNSRPDNHQVMDPVRAFYSSAPSTRGRDLDRYRREAEARRLRALRDWIAAKQT